MNRCGARRFGVELSYPQSVQILFSHFGDIRDGLSREIEGFPRELSLQTSQGGSLVPASIEDEVIQVMAGKVLHRKWAPPSPLPSGVPFVALGPDRGRVGRLFDEKGPAGLFRVLADHLQAHAPENAFRSSRVVLHIPACGADFITPDCGHGGIGEDPSRLEHLSKDSSDLGLDG